MSRFFDFHLHPSFKPFLSHPDPERRVDCWEYLESPIGIIRSQSCLDQMEKGRIGLAVSVIYAMERPMTSSFLIEHLAPKLTVLHGEMLDHPCYSNYLGYVHDEIAHLKKSQGVNGRTFNIINSIGEAEEGKMNLILALEGGHVLEQFNTNVLDNLRALKQGPHRFLYLTFVHMTQYPLATHAYGMKLIKNNDQFKPNGFGITDIGKEVIDMAYDESQGRRILIDIKHMSLVARHKFYQYRKQKGYDKIPIVATHMGFTGISKDPKEIVKYFSKPAKRRGNFIEVNYDRPPGIGKGLFNKTYFNPWSINLFDEDIAEILDSGGLIGLSLDQRIMGSQEVQGEFFSAREFNYILSGYKDEGHEEPVATGEFSDEEERARELNERKHLRHLCNNILHAVKAGGERAWKQLCMGSDFDGLIDPLNNCTSAEEYPKLERGLVEELPQMMKEDKKHNYDESNIEGKVRDIMYNNAVDFLKKNFK